MGRKLYSMAYDRFCSSIYSQILRGHIGLRAVFVLFLIIGNSSNSAAWQTVHSVSGEAPTCIEANLAAMQPAVLQEIPVVAAKFNLPTLSSNARDRVLAQASRLYTEVGKKGLKVREKRSKCRVRGKVLIGHASLRTAMQRAVCDTLVAEHGRKYVAVLIRFEQNAGPGDPVDSEFSDFQTFGEELHRKLEAQLNKCNVQVVDRYEYFPNTANILGSVEFKQISTSRGGLLSQMYTMAKDEHTYTRELNSQLPVVEEVLLGAIIVRNKGYNEIENRYEAEGTSDFGVRQLEGVRRFSFAPLERLGFGDTRQEAARHAARMIVQVIFDEYSTKLTAER